MYLHLKNIYDRDFEQIQEIGFEKWQDDIILNFWKQYILVICNYFICHSKYLNVMIEHVKENNISCTECDDFIQNIQNNNNIYKNKLQKIYHKYTKKRMIKSFSSLKNDFKEKKREIIVNLIESLLHLFTFQTPIFI